MSLITTLESQHQLTLLIQIDLPQEIFQEPDQTYVTTLPASLIEDIDPQTLAKKLPQIDTDWEEPQDWLPALKNNPHGRTLVILIPVDELTQQDFDPTQSAASAAHPKSRFILAQSLRDALTQVINVNPLNTRPCVSTLHPQTRTAH